MKKLFKFLGAGKEGAENGGVLNIISEKTGKISFRRVAATFVLVKMIPEIDWSNVSWQQALIIVICLTFSILDKYAEAILNKIK